MKASILSKPLRVQQKLYAAHLKREEKRKRKEMEHAQLHLAEKALARATKYASETKDDWEPQAEAALSSIMFEEALRGIGVPYTKEITAYINIKRREMIGGYIFTIHGKKFDLVRKYILSKKYKKVPRAIAKEIGFISDIKSLFSEARDALEPSPTLFLGLEVSNHAVNRYLQRVDGSLTFDEAKAKLDNIDFKSQPIECKGDAAILIQNGIKYVFSRDLLTLITVYSAEPEWKRWASA